MTSSLQLVKESFLQGGGGLHRGGVKLIFANVLLTFIYSSYVLHYGSWYGSFNLFEIVVALCNVLLHFFMFSFIAFIPLKDWIKKRLLLGLVMTQTGMILNWQSEFIRFDGFLWPFMGDLLYFFGGIAVAYGATHWVVYTYRMSTLDKLTKVHNRRFFEAMVDKQLQLDEESPEGSCMISMDLDNFKEINDKHGHSMGDRVLKIVGRILLDNARKEDVICRSGGEEFEVLLTRVSTAEAEEVAQRILTLLQQNTPAGLPPLSASIGIANACHNDTTDTLRRRADHAMYRAKKLGKAQVVAEFMPCH